MISLSGYARIILALISFYFMPTNPIVASVFYLLSGLLDAFDGWAARRFNQSMTFYQQRVHHIIHMLDPPRHQLWSSPGYGD